ncbi:MATE family efflux transporter [Butyrivibrio sp. AC2005]|uniref:MATE family efflux transporter n=1 Tax=Butyrivibrio sp. AC2005 TaxID=1280672 RepID=UPI0018C95640|nr:MATE family efflux transporter [Butyrivibrio sp. AC2005]
MSNTRNSNRREMMTQTPVPQLILRMSVPTIISMLVTAIYNTADTFFVGKISTQATAAVGIVFTVMALVQAIGFFCGHGSGNYLSRMLGAGKHKEADEMASTGFALAIIIGIIIAVIGNLFVKDLSYLIGATSTTLEDTQNYMRIILLGAPFMIGQFVINNQLRFQGSAMYAMVGLMCGAVMNMGLDPLLIFVFHLGVRGAALATIAGQITSFFVLYIGSKRGENIRLRLSNVHINGHYLYEIINGGAPSLFRQGMAAISTLLLNRAAGSLGGDAAIAGMSITTRVMMMLMSALIGFGQGYQPVCSFNYGAGFYKRVKEGYFFCVKYATIFLTIIGVICFAFAPQVIGSFRDDADVIAVGAVALRYQSATLPLGGALVISNMMLQSIGKGVKASITSSARNGIFFIPLILILPAVLGIRGVEMTQACADVLSLAITIPLAASELKKFK